MLGESYIPYFTKLKLLSSFSFSLSAINFFINKVHIIHATNKHKLTIQYIMTQALIPIILSIRLPPLRKKAAKTPIKEITNNIIFLEGNNIFS